MSHAVDPEQEFWDSLPEADQEMIDLFSALNGALSRIIDLQDIHGRLRRRDRLGIERALRNAVHKIPGSRNFKVKITNYRDGLVDIRVIDPEDSKRCMRYTGGPLKRHSSQDASAE